MNFNIALLSFINEKLKACQLETQFNYTILFNRMMEIQW